MKKTTRMLAVLTAASLGAALAGCAGIAADVRTAPPDAQLQGAHTYAFADAPLSALKDDTRQSEQWIETALARHGFVAADDASAAYRVSIAFDTRPASVGVDEPDCMGSACAGASSGGLGALFGGRRYRHSLTLRFFSNATGAERYTVSAASEDRDPRIVPALPYLVKSALARLPYVGEADWRVKLRTGADGAPEVVSVKPWQP